VLVSAVGSYTVVVAVGAVSPPLAEAEEVELGNERH
jgi:hypothetical protein